MKPEWEPALLCLLLEARPGSPEADLPEGSQRHVLWLASPADIGLAELGALLDSQSAIQGSFCCRRQELLGAPCGVIQFVGASPEQVAAAAELAARELSPRHALRLPSSLGASLEDAVRCALEAAELAAELPHFRGGSREPPRI